MPTFGKTLSHYGVLGMHWGRRKDDISRSKKIKAPPHPDHAQARELNRQGSRNLSNADLRKLNERLQLEQQYSKLKTDKTAIAKIKKGNDAVKVLIGVGTTVTAAAALLRTPVGQKAVARGATILNKYGVKAAMVIMKNL